MCTAPKPIITTKKKKKKYLEKVYFKTLIWLCATKNTCIPFYHKNLYFKCWFSRNSKSFHRMVSGSKSLIHGINTILNTIQLFKDTKISTSKAVQIFLNMQLFFVNHEKTFKLWMTVLAPAVLLWHCHTILAFKHHDLLFITHFAHVCILGCCRDYSLTHFRQN